MKKAYILTIFLMAAMTINGCSRAPAEKEPVIVADTFSEDKKISSSEDYGAESEASADPSELTDQTAESSKETETRKQTIEIEGMQEEIIGTVYHSDLGYQITYDADRFKYTRPIEKIDMFNAENPDPELYPYVYIDIRRVDKESMSNYWEFTSEDGSHITQDLFDEVQLGSYSASHYRSTSGNEWNSVVNNYYMIEHGDYYYSIITQYFLEAAEGYGARISAMLDTFTIE